MYTINTDKRSLGLNFNGNGNAVISLWAPLANAVQVEVNGNKKIELNKEDYGYWSLISSEISEEDRYFFILDGEKKLPDPASLMQPEGVHGPSLALDLNGYAWNDEKWKGIARDKMIIYELHVGTFTPEGSFQGMINKLDYLVDLGINTIEIMPVSQFPGDRNWGYDGVYIYAVQNSYGGADGLRDLIQACHERGIAVILDVVYNHNGPEGNYLPEYGPYFTGKYQIPWGDAMNYDDAYCYGVRQYYIENALMWFRDFHVDALRLDAVHAIKDMGARHFLAELSENVAKLKKKTGQNHLLIGECDLNDAKYIDSVKNRGYGLDAQWCDEFHHALHAVSTGERLEYYADFGEVKQIAKTIRDGFIYDGIYSPHRKKVFGTKVGDRPGDQLVVFIQNHDQVGNRMLGERLTTLIDFEKVKLLVGTLFISPFTPLIFMGEEYGETNPFLYFCSHSDAKLIQMVREGRRNEFKEFYHKGEPFDPQKKETFLRSKLSWDTRDDKHEKPLLTYYKYWIRLTKENPVLRNRDRRGLSVDILQRTDTIIVHRTHENHRLVGILNYNTKPEKVSLSSIDAMGMTILLDSSSASWGGPVPPKITSQPAQGVLTVNGNSIIVLSN
jgi:maltooligosyltrehalose trehalohydrolase